MELFLLGFRWWRLPPVCGSHFFLAVALRYLCLVFSSFFPSFFCCRLPQVYEFCAWGDVVRTGLFYAFGLLGLQGMSRGL